MKNILRTWLQYFLIASIGLPLLAQEGNASQEITRYLSGNIPIGNQNWNISQNPETGIVYFANSGGLGEYNGITVRMHNIPYRQSIRSVHVTTDGRIFTGSFEEFGYWTDSTNYGLIYKSISKDTEVEKNDEIWKIYESEGKVYFQSFTTIYCYDNRSVSSFKAPFTLLFLFQTGNRFICQVLGTGLYWFDGEKFEFIEGSEIFRTVKVHSVIKVTDSEIWICTANNGVYKFNGSDFAYFKSEISSFLAVQTCNAGLSVYDSLYVFGTISKGLVVCGRDGIIRENFTYENGLKNNTVLSLYRDHTNGLWIGLDEGANYIDLLSARTLYANSSGNLGTIYSVIRDENRLYLGTNHGLFQARVGQNNETYSFSDLRLIPRTQGQVWTMVKSEGQIICGHNDGTFLIDSGEPVQISDVTGGWTIREYNDLLIEGTYTGIIFFEKDAEGKWKFRNKVIGFNEPTRNVEIDYLGYIWASHPQKGFYKLELNEALDSVIQIRYFNQISGINSDIEIYKVNNQIVFTTSDSIYTFDYDQRKIIPLKPLNESLNEYRRSSQIIWYNKNLYWFVKENNVALFEISKDFVAIKKFELTQKYSYLPQRQLQITGLSENTVLVPARQAFITYNLPFLFKNSDTSKLAFVRLSLRGKKRSTEISVNRHEVISIPYNLNNLTAWFIDPSEFDNENKSFSYRLEGFEDTWHSTISDNLSYLNLPSGDYHLKLRSEFTGQTDDVFFKIKRPWYLQGSAFLVYLILVTATAILTLLWYRNKLRRQRQLIEFELSNTKLANELDFKSYELMLTMRYLIEKNEILTELSEKIEALREQSPRAPVKPIREMEKVISRAHIQTQEWKDALSSLKLTQQGFFKHLIEKHPNLTPNDLRLCSYLRMNFTTKEIARLLNISGRAVEISRYRLRRKMNLDHSVNLTEYLIREID